MSDVAIKILASASDEVGEREDMLPDGTTSLLVDVLADAGFIVISIDVEVSIP